MRVGKRDSSDGAGGSFVVALLGCHVVVGRDHKLCLVLCAGFMQASARVARTQRLPNTHHGRKAPAAYRESVSKESSTAEQKQYREAGDVRGRKRVQSTKPRRMPATRDESLSSIAQRPRV